MPRIAIAQQLRACTSIMCLIIALAASPEHGAIARWQFTYPYSGNLEANRVYTEGELLHYERIAIDAQTRAAVGPSLVDSMRIDNVRDVTTNRTATEIDVQVWGVLNTSVLVLHFNTSQSELALRVAHELERLEYRGYLPMQKRAKMPVSSSSFATSPVS